MPTDWELQKATWTAYKQTFQYLESVEHLTRVGMVQPYINNLLKRSFDYAWQAKKVKVIVKGELTQGEKRRKNPK